MKRKIFFWLEKLSISRIERNAVAVLMSILLLLVLIRLAVLESAAFDDAYYAELDEAFKTRSALLKHKEENIMARYQPKRSEAAIVFQDTVPRDTPDTFSNSTRKDSGRELTKVNVNTADAKTLETLPGIGPAYASRMIQYRQENGPFETCDELLKIKGIGKKRLEKLLPFIQLTESIENK